LWVGADRRQYGNWSHPRNYSAAYKWYKQLADLTGNATAQHMIGFMHATGFGGAVPKDQGRVGTPECYRKASWLTGI
jgi:SEL1 protein